MLRAAPFVIAGIFSGLEAENVAVGVVAAGLALIGARTAPAAGVVLLAAFAACMWYLVTASRRHDFLGGESAEIREELEEHAADKRRWWRPVRLTLFGLAVITVGAELRR